jgi:TM2 domain-containing membrane protein YozV/RNA polymerase subunit RPABC4/transcription elongation factor Spt4
MVYCTSCGAEVQPAAKFCPNCGKPMDTSPPPTPQSQAQNPSLPPQDRFYAGGTKYCQHCGAVIAAAAEICPSCGVRVMEQPRAVVPLKNPGIAAVLSFLFTGLGQIYNGQIGKGIAFIVAGFVCLVLIIVLIGILLYPLFWIYNIYDAYKSAEGINAGTIRPD